MIDLTSEQLATGREGAARDGVSNVAFVEGDAAAMPFDDGSFDVAVSRFAFHHLPDPGAVAAEMRRVVRPGGRVAITDMVDEGERHNEFERLRDPSHTSALTDEALEALFDGLEIVARDERRQAIPLEPWLRQSRTPDDAARLIEDAVRTEVGGGARTGLHGHADEDGALHIAQRWVVLVGRSADR